MKTAIVLVEKKLLKMMERSPRKQRKNTLDKNVWLNPAIDVVVTSIFNTSADEVKLRRPGSTMVETYVLVSTTQKCNTLCYLRNPEAGTKWKKMWPFPKELTKSDGDIKKDLRLRLKAPREE